MTTHTATAPSTISRQERLAERIATVRARAGTGRYDRWLLIIGGTLMPLGILLVILGWIGAAHTVLVFDQIPYLISGGLLGVALTFAGGFTYFTYWQTLRVRESRAQHQEFLDAIRRLERTLTGEAAPAVAGRLVATATGAMVHRPDCPIVAGHDDLRDVDPSTPNLQACRICTPDVAAART
jgi:hypothetical protein